MNNVEPSVVIESNGIHWRTKAQNSDTVKYLVNVGQVWNLNPEPRFLHTFNISLVICEEIVYWNIRSINRLLQRGGECKQSINY